mgnify:CR=1 FL=1
MRLHRPTREAEREGLGRRIICSDLSHRAWPLWRLQVGSPAPARPPLDSTDFTVASVSIYRDSRLMCSAPNVRQALTRLPSNAQHARRRRALSGGSYRRFAVLLCPVSIQALWCWASPRKRASTLQLVVASALATPPISCARCSAGGPDIYQDGWRCAHKGKALPDRQCLRF